MTSALNGRGAGSEVDDSTDKLHDNYKGERIKKILNSAEVIYGLYLLSAPTLRFGVLLLSRPRRRQGRVWNLFLLVAARKLHYLRLVCTLSLVNMGQVIKGALLSVVLR